MFILNPNSGIPIYRQLIDQIRRMIVSSQLKVGDELPSVRELAEQHAINPMTISKAYSLLEAEGLLERQRGKPMMVAATARANSHPQARIAQLQPQIEQLLLSARQLNISTTELVNAIIEQGDKA